MRSDELLRHGEHVMTVCNACRYCEQFCPVFPAMEKRLTFAKTDLTYLANLCHNCGECLYACQYAPPHEFGINVPRTLAEIRVFSYEDYSWPRFLGAAFRHHGLLTSVGLPLVLSGILLAGTLKAGINPMAAPEAKGDFYTVISHQAMVSLFGAVSIFVVIAMVVAVCRFWRDMRGNRSELLAPFALRRAARDVFTLRHLHANGIDCTAAEESRPPWRRWFHHCTFYGFMLCLASTSVAAIYHNAFGWEAPYGYSSLPVLLGTVGGVGLLVGPAGLLLMKMRRDPALGDPAQSGLDVSFIALLLLTSLSGLLLMIFRDSSIMGPLLIGHLGIVLALFLTMPYGKFVHGLFRAAALLNSALEDAQSEPEPGPPLKAPTPGRHPLPAQAPAAGGRATAMASIDRSAHEGEELLATEID
jgi:citrate/tricarballylate utilization protein